MSDLDRLTSPPGGLSARVYAALGVGVVAMSAGAIFVRLAEAPALTLAAYRLVLAAVPMGSYALVRHRGELKALDRRSGGLLAVSGLAMALYFATWNASLQRTSVASSVSLVCTQPIWVAILSALFLGERIRARTGVAIAVGLLGSALVAGADIQIQGKALGGDALAIAGAIFGSIYFVVGRRVRPSLSLATYVGVVYGVAALAMVIGAACVRASLSGFSTQTWLMFVLSALIPQLVGHSLLNWSLKYVTAPLVSLAILAEPVISTLLAIPVLGEWPGRLQAAGGALTLVGVYVAAREEAPRAPEGAPGTPTLSAANP